MAELLQTRIISGKGSVRLDKITDSKYRVLQLYIDVIRLPKNEYKNFKHNPYQSFYANVCFMRNGYVLDKRQIEYTTELWQFVPDDSGQVLLGLKCHLDLTFQSIINLGLSLGKPPISVENLIREFTNLSLGFDTLNFVCYSNSAIRIRLYGIPYMRCSDADVTEEGGGEPPVPQPGLVPTDDPLEVSPPYDPDTNDDGSFDPFPDDLVDDEFEGDICSVYEIVVRISGPNFVDGFFDTTLRVFAPYRAAFDPQNSQRIGVYCRGLYVDETSVCGSQIFHEIIVGFTPPAEVDIISEVELF